MAERNKRIFISDIHMGDEESLHPSNGLKSWGWLKEDRCEMLAEFLLKQSNDPTVKQVVVLGDLFDEWICPTTISPTPAAGSGFKNQFEKIAAAKQNAGIIKNMNRITEGGKIELVYVPGNHDMLMTEDILKSIIPNAIWKGTTPGQGYYEEDGIAAEHGHKYCLFCAPDVYDNPPHFLPLGHFISRVVSEHVARTGEDINAIKILAETILKLLGDEMFAKSVFSSIVNACELNDKSEVLMNGLNDYLNSLQIYQPEGWFSDLYERWEKMRPGNVSKIDAVLDETGSLHWAVMSQYVMKEGKPDIVVFGHTHNYTIHGYLFGVDGIEEEELTDLSIIPYKHIYANSGTWINDKKRCTFVETQKDIGEGKHYVWVNEYKPDGTIKCLGERFKQL